MKNGKVLKERWEYYKEVFTTRDGLVSFFIVGAIWAFIIVNHTDKIYGYVEGFVHFLPEGLLRTYASYLVFNMSLALIWWVILWAVINIINKLLGGDGAQSFRGR